MGFCRAKCRFPRPAPSGTAGPTDLIGAVLPARGGSLTEVNQLRLADFRSALAIAPNARAVATESWDAALAAGRLVPIRTLISDPAAIHGAGDNISFRYAQAWALVYYLHREKPGAFADYLRELAARNSRRAIQTADEVALFERCFGPADLNLETGMREFVVRLRFHPLDAD